MTTPGPQPSGRTEPPPLEMGDPMAAAWREEAMTRAVELRGLAEWIRDQDGTSPADRQLAEKAARHLERVLVTRRPSTGAGRGRAGGPSPWWWQSFRGASVERALGTLDAVEADLLRAAPDDFVAGLIPSITAHVNRYLPKGDPRRIRLERLAADPPNPPLSGQPSPPLTAADRGMAIAAYHAANSQRRRELLRLATFRNVLALAAALLLVIAIGLGILGSVRPDLIPLCFNPDGKVVCPTEESSFRGGAGALDDEIADTVSPWDLWLVELLGLVAAAVASAVALRGLQSSSTPYGLPVALAFLKLSTGCLTAILGLLLMRGGFVPGLSALDSSAQILSWAIVFGYAQQLFTRFADQQAGTVIENLRGRGAAGDRPVEPRTGRRAMTSGA